MKNPTQSISIDKHLHLQTTTPTGKHGRIAENLATWFLKSHHYKILDRNFRSNTGEIDIIAMQAGPQFPSVHFIEVKSRYGNPRTKPEYAVTYAKQKRIFATARFWLLTHHQNHVVCHFDIVAIQTKYSKLPHINYIHDAYYPRQEYGW